MMPSIKSLHHWAYRCRDAEETRHFYEDILGLPLAHVISEDHVPSTGEYLVWLRMLQHQGCRAEALSEMLPLGGWMANVTPWL